jgi:hypothetical protein
MLQTVLSFSPVTKHPLANKTIGFARLHLIGMDVLLTCTNHPPGLHENNPITEIAIIAELRAARAQIAVGRSVPVAEPHTKVRIVDGPGTAL